MLIKSQRVHHSIKFVSETNISFHVFISQASYISESSHKKSISNSFIGIQNHKSIQCVNIIFILGILF